MRRKWPFFAALKRLKIPAFLVCWHQKWHFWPFFIQNHHLVGQECIKKWPYTLRQMGIRLDLVKTKKNQHFLTKLPKSTKTINFFHVTHFKRSKNQTNWHIKVSWVVVRELQIARKKWFEKYRWGENESKYAITCTFEWRFLGNQETVY